MYNEVKDFIKKLRVCDMDFISPEEIITYEFHVQYYTREYHGIVD